MKNDPATSPTPPLSADSPPLLTIKVKRWEYEITEADKFLDNGACIQLLTQAKQTDSWARKITPILSKKAIDQLGKFKRVPREYPGLLGENVFSLGTDKLPFTPPFRVISEFSCGTDAHIIDSGGNVIVASSEWASRPDLKHKPAMDIICGLLNDKFPTESQP